MTGGTGFLGRPMVRRLLKAGHQVRVLSRDAVAAERMLPREAETYTWQAPDPVPPQALAGVDAVAHCLGENVGQWPWNEEKKRAFRASRVDSTRCLVASLAALPAAQRPKAFVSASAVGYYGDGGDAWRRESDPPGAGFLAGLVKDWEAEIFRAEALGIRTAALRFGVVLGDGGALAKMLLPFRLGLGAVVGSGRQWLGWIHRTDAAEALIQALGDGAWRGAINAVAPQPVTNREFSRALARALRRPLLLRAPAFALEAVLGEMARETLLASQRVSADRIVALQYPFRYPSLEGALRDILDHARKKRG